MHACLPTCVRASVRTGRKPSVLCYNQQTSIRTVEGEGKGRMSFFPPVLLVSALVFIDSNIEKNEEPRLGQRPPRPRGGGGITGMS